MASENWLQLSAEKLQVRSFFIICYDQKLLGKLNQKLLHLCVLNFMHVIDLKIQNYPDF